MAMNKYWQDALTNSTLQYASSSAQSFVSGTAAFAWLGPFAPLAGGIVANISGWVSALTSFFNMYNDVKGKRDQLVIDRNETQYDRNKTINTIQQYINNTRSSIDSVYGEGVFDMYDDLFASVFNLDADESTLSDLLESLKLDTTTGTIATTVLGKGNSAFTESLSLSDINDKYREYMGEVIRGANTAIGKQFQMRTLQEQNLHSNYMDTIAGYNLDLARQFEETFLQQRTQNIAGEMAMGEAYTAQAGSGIRAVGSGQTLTNLQQFQNDLSNIAYAAGLDYMLKDYQMTVANAGKSLTQQITESRLQTAIDTENILVQILQQYNQTNQQLYQGYVSIKEDEETVIEANKELAEMDEFLVFDKRAETTMENIF